MTWCTDATRFAGQAAGHLLARSDSSSSRRSDRALPIRTAGNCRRFRPVATRRSSSTTHQSGAVPTGGGRTGLGWWHAYILCVPLREDKAIDVAGTPSNLLQSDSSLWLVLVGMAAAPGTGEPRPSLGIRHRTMFLGTQGEFEIINLSMVRGQSCRHGWSHLARHHEAMAARSRWWRAASAHSRDHRA